VVDTRFFTGRKADISGTQQFTDSSRKELRVIAILPHSLKYHQLPPETEAGSSSHTESPSLPNPSTKASTTQLHDRSFFPHIFTTISSTFAPNIGPSWLSIDLWLHFEDFPQSLSPTSIYLPILNLERSSYFPKKTSSPTNIHQSSATTTLSTNNHKILLQYGSPSVSHSTARTASTATSS
jgi:hypothetical protein